MGDPDAPFDTDIAARVWASRYRWQPARGRPEPDIRASWRRVAAALASVEPHDRDAWAQRFEAVLEDFRFLPGGRILAGAGTGRPDTLFNCFVGPAPDARMDRLAQCLDSTARTLFAGGGIGADFSGVPPAAWAGGLDAVTLGGPAALLPVWDALCAAIGAGRVRRGAMMATLACDHPDLGAFIAAKDAPGALPRFTLSVLASDAWLADRGVDAQRDWHRLLARMLDHAEPGLVFIDTVRRLNPLAYAEHIEATNPCGEVPLPRHGACDLGSLNLTRFVRDPFGPAATLDLAGLLACVPLAVRMLDNVYDLSPFPTAAQRDTACSSRRLGLGFTGLADALAMLGLDYRQAPARALAGRVMHRLCVAAYAASTALAREKGAFPCFDAGAHLRGEFVARLPQALRRRIARQGLRNSHLLAIAPAGSISLLANGISSGIEPLPALSLRRTLRLRADCTEQVHLQSHALALFRRRFGPDAVLPRALVTAAQVPPIAQVRMQAAVQRHVDNAIAKTITLPGDATAADLDLTLRQAHALGLKGCTAYRPGSHAGAVVEPLAAPALSPR